VSCKNGVYNIVQGLDINEFSQNKLNAPQKELEEERDAISSLLG
jgi:malate dehydrogenase